MFRHGARAGFLRRETDGSVGGFEAVSDDLAQFVLGRHGRDSHASARQFFEDGGSAEERIIETHEFLARVLVEEEIPGNAVRGGRCARDDGEVVGVRERRHRTFGRHCESRLDELAHVGKYSVRDAFVQVLRVESVDTYYDCGAFGECVYASMHLDERRGLLMI